MQFLRHHYLLSSHLLASCGLTIVFLFINQILKRKELKNNHEECVDSISISDDPSPHRNSPKEKSHCKKFFIFPVWAFSFCTLIPPHTHTHSDHFTDGLPFTPPPSMLPSHILLTNSRSSVLVTCPNHLVVVRKTTIRLLLVVFLTT